MVTRSLSALCAFALSVLSGSLLYAQSGGWTKQPTGFTGDIFSVQFSDSVHGTAVGSMGYSAATIDGGYSWERKTIVPYTDYSDLFFVDANTGWLVGSNNAILKTTDGGTTYKAQTPITSTANGYSGVWFVNNQTGWVVGGSGKIVSTVDGGLNWTPQTSGIAHGLRKIQFMDSQTGWAVGLNGTILKTTNGGQNWVSLPSNTTADLLSLNFINSQLGWVAGDNGTVLKTLDGGSSWTTVTMPNADSFLDVDFYDANKGIVTSHFHSYMTTNGGATWTTMDLYGYDADWMNADTAYVVAGPNYNKIYRITTSSTVAEDIGGMMPNTKIQCMAPNRLYMAGRSGEFRALGVDPSQPVHQIYQINYATNLQQDYGLTHTKRHVGNRYICAGGADAIFFSSNEGEDWSYNMIEPGQSVFDADFTDQDNGWAVVGNTIRKTTDGGATWIPQYTISVPPTLNPTGFNIKIQMLNDQTGWVTHPSGYVFRTVNGGSTWTPHQIDSTLGLHSLHFVSAQVGWIAASEQQVFSSKPVLLKTTDGGASWIRVSLPVDMEEGTLSSVFFLNASTGWVTGSSMPTGAYVLGTLDGGATWDLQVVDSDPLVWIYSVYFKDANNGWITGTDHGIAGLIYHTTTGGRPFTGVSSKIGKANLDIFPNPAQNRVTIRSGSTVRKVELCNAIGSRFPAPLTDNGEVDIERLPTGSYWLKVETDEGRVTKMVLKE